MQLTQQACSQRVRVNVICPLCAQIAANSERRTDADARQPQTRCLNLKVAIAACNLRVNKRNECS